MGKIEVVSVRNDDDSFNSNSGQRVTLKNEDGKNFTVNIPYDCWGTDEIFGLNLVFDHSGNGDHYE